MQRRAQKTLPASSPLRVRHVPRAEERQGCRSTLLPGHWLTAPLHSYQSLRNRSPHGSDRDLYSTVTWDMVKAIPSIA